MLALDLMAQMPNIDDIKPKAQDEIPVLETSPLKNQDKSAIIKTFKENAFQDLVDSTTKYASIIS